MLSIMEGHRIRGDGFPLVIITGTTLPARLVVILARLDLKDGRRRWITESATEHPSDLQELFTGVAESGVSEDVVIDGVAYVDLCVQLGFL